MQSQPSVRSTLALVALAAFTVWITWRAKVLELSPGWGDRPSVLMGKQAPDFSLQSLDGRPVSLADYRGKTLGVTFWASWCGPCRMEIPGLTRLYKQSHKSDSNFEILAISVDATRDAAKAAAHSMHMEFPVLLDADNRVSEAYHVDAIPTLFVIGRDGKVVFSHTGFYMGLDTTLAQQFGIRNYNPTGGNP